MCLAMNNTHYTIVSSAVRLSAVLPSTELSPQQQQHKAVCYLCKSSIKLMILCFKCRIYSQSETQTTAGCALLSYQMQTQLPEPWGLGWRGELTEEQLDRAGPRKNGAYLYKMGKHWREKMVTALCLTREFCFHIVKGFINIKLSLFCDLRWSVERCYRSAQCHCDDCALSCWANVNYSESTDPHGGFLHSSEYECHVWTVALQINVNLIADDFQFLS